MPPRITPSTDQPSSGTATFGKSLTMQLSEAAPCQQSIRAHLSAEGVQPIRDAVLQEFQREATVAGFRKGKAPRELVERKYGEDIREEVVRRSTRQIFERVAEAHHLRPVGPFEVSKLEFDPARGLDVEALIEVEPNFSLAEYKGIRLTRRPVTVTPEDREQALQRLQESMAELVPSAEGQAKEKRVPTRDDEFAKDLGFETLEKLTEHVEAKLREQKQREQQQALEQSLCDELLARHRFDVPPRLVAGQTERLTRDFQVRLLLGGLTEEQAKEELAKYTEQLQHNAVQHVKLALILERVAEHEQLSITQDELLDRLWKLAKRWGKDPSEVRKLLDERGLWPSVLSSIRQEKSLKMLLDAAHIEEATSDK